MSFFFSLQGTWDQLNHLKDVLGILNKQNSTNFEKQKKQACTIIEKSQKDERNKKWVKPLEFLLKREFHIPREFTTKKVLTMNSTI